MMHCYRINSPTLYDAVKISFISTSYITNAAYYMLMNP